jgi:hypothetical protein
LKEVPKVPINAIEKTLTTSTNHLDMHTQTESKPSARESDSDKALGTDFENPLSTRRNLLPQNLMSDINKRIEEFQKILSNESSDPKSTLDHSRNQSTQVHFSLTPSKTYESKDTQTPDKFASNDSKKSSKLHKLSRPSSTPSSPKHPHPSPLLDHIESIQQQLLHKIIDKSPFSTHLHSYQPSAQNSPSKKPSNLPSLNVSEISKHKFFSDKEWSQPVSPSNDFLHFDRTKPQENLNLEKAGKL